MPWVLRLECVTCQDVLPMWSPLQGSSGCHWTSADTGGCGIVLEESLHGRWLEFAHAVQSSASASERLSLSGRTPGLRVFADGTIKGLSRLQDSFLGERCPEFPEHSIARDRGSRKLAALHRFVCTCLGRHRQHLSLLQLQLQHLSRPRRRSAPRACVEQA